MRRTLAALAVIALLFAAWSFHRSSPEVRELGFSASVEAARDTAPSESLDLPSEGVASAGVPAVVALATQRVSVASPFATLEVAVLDLGGKPIAGLTVVVAPRLDEETRAEGSYRNDGIRFARTGASGTVVISDLAAREYEVSCQAADASVTVRESALLAAGERRALELRFRPELTPPICVAGIVVDESGLPVSGIKVRLFVDGIAIPAAWSDEEGRFQQTYPQGREVEANVGNGPKDDEYEPRSTVVRFGTQSLGFRRVREVPMITVDVVCVDPSTGEPFQPEFVSIQMSRVATPREQLSFIVGPDDPRFTVRDHPDWRATAVVPRIGIMDASLVTELKGGARVGKLTLTQRIAFK